MQGMSVGVTDIGVMVVAEEEVIAGALVVVAVFQSIDSRLGGRFVTITETNDLKKGQKRTIHKDQPGGLTLRMDVFKGRARRQVDFTPLFETFSVSGERVPLASTEKA